MMESAVNSMRRWIACFVLPVCLLAGCSGVKPYPDSSSKNLYLHTRTDPGTLFSSVRAAVDIYRVDALCQVEYQGTVDLDTPSMAIGIPVDEPSYLVFGFASSSWLANSKSNISYDTLLAPRAGYDYEIEISYLDEMYNVAILEKFPGGKNALKISQQSVSGCTPR